MSDITDRVKKIVVEHLNVDEAKVSDDASSLKSLEWYPKLKMAMIKIINVNFEFLRIVFW